MSEKTSTEFEITVSGGRVIEAKVMPDGSCVLTVKLETALAENTTRNQQKGIFRKVPASELRLDDAFMKHRTKTNAEKTLKNLIGIAIKNGVKDFWRPIIDPSFDVNGGICYKPGKKPAVGKSYNWWEKTAKNFCPESGSRMGTKSEYVAFLAVLIKDLVASGWNLADAWSAVCNSSKELGHYWNSKDAKHEFEDTGSREICGWYDLANTGKFLKEDEETRGFWLAGSSYCNMGNLGPLADMYLHCDLNDDYHYSCGWIVLDSCPDGLLGGKHYEQQNNSRI